jgi:hypothetical protein
MIKEKRKYVKKSTTQPEDLPTLLLFEKIISQKLWYKSLGYDHVHAYTLKRRFYAKTLKLSTIEKILRQLGYTKKIYWTIEN